jgi:RNA polymerase sigma-70 factor, ECF subfamily
LDLIFLLEEENPIELAYFRGRSQRKISKRSGMPLGTVKSRTKSAFKRLRRELAVGDTLQEPI